MRTTILILPDADRPRTRCGRCGRTPALGTSSTPPDTDRIGLMPDLRKSAIYLGIASHPVERK